MYKDFNVSIRFIILTEVLAGYTERRGEQRTRGRDGIDRTEVGTDRIYFGVELS